MKKVKLPDETAALEGHLWDELLNPHASDAAKDVRIWVMNHVVPVLIFNDREVEIIEQRTTKPHFSKWKFRSAQAAYKFGEMMLPYASVIGLPVG